MKNELEKLNLGIDLGGTRIKMALVRENGELVRLEILDAKADLPLPQRLEELVKDINRLLGSEFELRGIGISFPGIVDFAQKKVISKYVKYPEAHKTDLAAWAHKYWRVPLIVENDARAALVGEWRHGAGKGSDNLLMVTLGTGMGSAVLIDGKLLRGKNFLAGNLGGHMAIDFEGDLCNCGNVGCVETAGSTWALGNNFKKIPGFRSSSLFKEEVLSFKSVFQAAEQGDSVAGELKTKSLEAWAAGIINLLHAYDPEKLIVGGGIMASKDQIIPFLEQRVQERSWLPESGVPILAAEQPKYAGILGISYLLNQIEF